MHNERIINALRQVLHLRLILCGHIFLVPKDLPHYFVCVYKNSYNKNEQSVTVLITFILRRKVK